MTKERFLTLTDAMVSIIATIMVLDLPRPAAINLQSLSSLTLPFFAYFLSFFMIWNVWYNHHSLFKEVRTINSRIYWYTGFWLFVMSFFPWVTGLVGAHPMSVLPELLYLLVSVLWAAFYELTQREILKENKHLAGQHFSYRGWIRWITIVLNALGFVVVWIFPPYVLLMMALFTLISFIAQWQETAVKG